MAELAHIHILDIPYHADKPYTYYIPPDMKDHCAPGCLVEVPFGIGNRRMTGIVTELFDGKTKPEYKPLYTCGDTPLLFPELLSLCHFIKEYTLCTLGEAVHAVVPGAALTKITEFYRALPMPEMAPLQLSERAVQVYHHLTGKKRMTKQRLQSEFSFDCTAPLLSLQQNGLVEKLTTTKDPSEGRMQLLYTLTEKAAALLAEQGVENLTSGWQSAHQKNLFTQLAALYAANTGDSPKKQALAEEKELLATCGVSPATGKACLKRLMAAGLVRAIQETVYRDPFRMPEAAEPEGTPHPLNEEQQQALNTILSLYRQKEPKAALLHGVTGSGKTNVMLAAIEQVLADGRGVLLLIPEIALTPQTVHIYRRRFGERIAVLHSGLSAAEKLDAWRRIRDGLADVVIGTRSAIFAPLPKIGMILIDEEHEYTYKSDADPKYHAHDIARFRCKEHGAMMLLASATPSVTSYYKAMTGVYTLVQLKTRYNKGPLPQVEIYDMRGTPGNRVVGDMLSDRLLSDKALGNQSILFLNRRGYNHFVSCRSCGKSLQCPQCSVSMTYHTRRGSSPAKDVAESDMSPEAYQKYHRANGYLTCHLCGYRTPVPDVCPVCGMPHFLYMGSGTQKAEDDLEVQFPTLRILRMDADTTQSKFSHEEYLTRFRAGEADVLLGTQMVTKGHDFPKVATVGVLNADASLFVDDYRANERTFSMLTQVIGRAGRGDIPGYAIVQTRNPDNEVLHLAAAQDYETFYTGEIRLRKALCFPPFCDIAVLTISSREEGVLGKAVASMQSRIREYASREFDDVPLVVFGPFEAPVYRVQNVFRMRFVLKCRLNKRTRTFIDRLLCEYSSGTQPTLGEVGYVKKPAPNQEIRLHGRGDRRITVTVDLNPSTI